MVDAGDLERRVRAALTEQCAVPLDASILVLVSGGADSTALMHLLRTAHPGPVVIASFDHGLRVESADEVDAVGRQAAALGLSFHARRLSLEPGAGLQERARDARYAAADEIAREVGVDLIATGHTATDQAETILFRLARGTGRTGALGISPRRGNIIRPVLGLTRDETRGYCEVRGVPWTDDPSNADARFTRSRIRHGLVAELARVHPGAVTNLAAFADRLRDEDAVFEVIIAAAAERCTEGGGLRMAHVTREPRAIARLLVRTLIDDAGLDPASAATVDRILQMVPGTGPIQLPGGAVAAVDRGCLVVEVSGKSVPPVTVDLLVPGSVTFGVARLNAERGPAGPPSPNAVSIDHPGPLVVRAPRPGDRLEMTGGWHKRVGPLLAEAGVPARHRGRVPVVVAGGKPVWVVGHRAATALLAKGGRAASNVNLQSFGSHEHD